MSSFTTKVATALGVVALALGAYAGDADTADATGRREPLLLTDESVLAGALQIGNLSVDRHLEVDSRPPSAPEADVLQRCIDEGPEWLSWSDDGTTLELATPYGATQLDEVLSAHCTDGVILIGGSRRDNAGEIPTYDGPPRPRAWLFSMVNGTQSSPTMTLFTDTYAVGPWARPVRYSLNEVRSIDLGAGIIAFSGSSPDGHRALLDARLAISRH